MIMAKTMQCNALGFDCGFVAKADSEEALLQQVAQHANEVHGITEVTPELVEQVKSLIREE
jgi:predicted small metal-binding protein